MCARSEENGVSLLFIGGISPVPHFLVVPLLKANWPLPPPSASGFFFFPRFFFSRSRDEEGGNSPSFPLFSFPGIVKDSFPLHQKEELHADSPPFWGGPFAIFPLPPLFSRTRMFKGNVFCWYGLLYFPPFPLRSRKEMLMIGAFSFTFRD